METDSRKGRPPTISDDERTRLLDVKGLNSERWALDQRFKEAASEALRDGSYPFILPVGKKPRSSLLVELGRWKDAHLIKLVALRLEEAASENKELTIKKAISTSRAARLKLMNEQMEMPDVEEKESEPQTNSLDTTLSTSAQEDDRPVHNDRPSREEWDQLSKSEQWEQIKNMDLKEATKGMSDSERSRYIEKLQKVSGLIGMRDGYRKL